LPHLVGVKVPNFIAFLVDCRYRYRTGPNGAKRAFFVTYCYLKRAADSGTEPLTKSH
jgi:hypothetical protein